MKADPAINMPAEFEDRLVPVKFCSPKALELRDKVWTRLKS
jgi:spermidine/putrescine transport system substrate-binding protein